MKLYLAGPMTGIPDRNFPAFHAAAKILRESRHQVVSPAELNEEAIYAVHPTKEHRAACMRRDIYGLMTCTGIVLLPNWTFSQGAKCEHSIAVQLNMRIFDYFDERLIELF